MKKIGIIGGGILGMSLAYYLSKANAGDITLIEKGETLGGLAGGFKIKEADLERYYHHIFKSDYDLQNLIAELGLKADLKWRKSKVGIYANGKSYDFSTSFSLLTFPKLSLFGRLRAGFISLYLQKVKNVQKFENITALDWCNKFYGQEVTNVIWKPLLLGKFGEDSYSKISMAWLWTRIHDRSSSRKGIGYEYLGYPDGSFVKLINTLENKLIEQGVRIIKGAVVSQHKLNNGMHDLKINDAFSTFTDLVVTTSPDAFLNTFKIPDEYKKEIQSVKYLGAICFCLELNKSFSPFYWLNITDTTFPFLAVVEHTNFVEKELFGGSSILYIAKYLPKDDALFAMSEDEVLNKCVEYLKKINPGFDKSWIISKYYFKSEYAQHIVPVGYKPVPNKTGIKGLYYANFSQIYPHDRGMSYAVQQAKNLMKLILNK